VAWHVCPEGMVARHVCPTYMVARHVCPAGMVARHVCPAGVSVADLLRSLHLKESFNYLNTHIMKSTGF